MSKDTGGPAFPATNHHGHKLEGMTLRDYFAAKAMQGVLSRPTAGLLHAEGIAPAAYMMADAMLKARGNT
jgi:hypothetical protein